MGHPWVGGPYFKSATCQRTRKLQEELWPRALTPNKDSQRRAINQPPTGRLKAYDRDSDQLIDWECGNRDVATLRRLLEWLSRWDIELFCTDNLAAYRKEIMPPLPVVSKR